MNRHFVNINSAVDTLDVQGVPRLLSQLSEAVISLDVDGIKYHLNHLIPTLGDFV